MEIRIDTRILIDNNLTISEYLWLKIQYEKKSDLEVYLVIDKVDPDLLQHKGFIKLLDSEVVLRTKAIELFEGKDLFEKFLTTFPVKAPSGRYLSPLRSATINGKKLKKKWKSTFKGNPHLEQKAYEVLLAELKWRRENNSMEFIHNMETWLNKGDHENYAYLLEQQKTEDRDLM